MLYFSSFKCFLKQNRRNWCEYLVYFSADFSSCVLVSVATLFCLLPAVLCISHCWKNWVKFEKLSEMVFLYSLEGTNVRNWCRILLESFNLEDILVMLTKNVFLSSVAICMQVVKFIFHERGVQFLCSMLSFDSAFFPQSNYFIDKKILLML